LKIFQECEVINKFIELDEASFFWHACDDASEYCDLFLLKISELVYGLRVHPIVYLQDTIGRYFRWLRALAGEEVPTWSARWTPSWCGRKQQDEDWPINIRNCTTPSCRRRWENCGGNL